MYSSGMLDQRITIHIPGEEIQDEWGAHQGEATTIERWASVTFNRGASSMREGAIDAYDTILIRMRDDEALNRDYKIEWDERLWKINSLNRDKRQGDIQLTCTEVDNSADENEE